MTLLVNFTPSSQQTSGGNNNTVRNAIIGSTSVEERDGSDSTK